MQQGIYFGQIIMVALVEIKLVNTQLLDRQSILPLLQDCKIQWGLQ
jgi:hypothetical protein